MSHLYIISDPLHDKIEQQFHVIRFKDEKMVKYYQNMGYIVYLILIVDNAFYFDYMDYNYTKQDIQLLIDMCLERKAKVLKYGVHFFSD